MRGTRGESAHARATVAALANLLIFGLAACGENPSVEEPARGRGLLVSPREEITACAKAVYEGPETLLYSNRPYHTEGTAAVARGLTFCRGARHGTNVWAIDVVRPTLLVVFGNAADGLDARGWTRDDEPLEVAAAGVPLNQIYTRSFPVGRYVIRQGFTPAAPIVLWDATAARLAR